MLFSFSQRTVNVWNKLSTDCVASNIGLSQKNKSKFQVSQNKVVRYLLNLTPRTHVGVNEFKAVKMLPVNYRVDQLKLNLMFNINHGMAPSYLFSSHVRDQHSIGTRSREYDVVVPRVRGP